MIRSSLCFTTLLCFFSFTACQDAPADSGSDPADTPATYSATTPVETAKPTSPSPEKAATATLEALASDDPFVISGRRVLGIRPGDAIASVNNVKKATLKTGEGDFTVYDLVDEGGKKLGYLMPDFNDSKKVGSIHVTSDMLTTPEGISVGSTFEELEKMMKGVVVHGSEVEGRTYATVGKISFRLDAANFSYKVEKSEIKPGTKITEIVVE